MALTDITSGTLISLTLTETLGMVAFAVSVLVGVIAFVRKDERDRARLDQLEKRGDHQDANMETLTALVQQVAKSVDRLIANEENRANPTRRKPNPNA